MCGIGGVFNKAEKIDEASLARMLSSITYRGRDGSGTYKHGKVGLVHARLAIIDLSEAAAQPLFDRSGRYGIVYNGEIYGYKELRKELESSGALFDSESDTEVILEGYKIWGIERLCQVLQGMFAFAIWDCQEEKLILGRDRLGEKPLFTYAQPSEFVFASNLQGIFAYLPTTPILKKTGIFEYLKRGYISPNCQLVDGIEEVAPGTYWIISKQGIEKHTYFSYQIANKENGISADLDSLVASLSETLNEVVADELVADVAVGTLLSGGVDSSLVTYFASKHREIDAFTVAMPYGIDESELAKQTARTLSVRHHVIPAVLPVFTEVEALLQQFSYPLGDSSAVGMYIISKTAADYVKVLLTGDGGDEFFAGYNSVKLHADYNHYRRYFDNALFRGISNQLSTSKLILEHASLRKLNTALHVVSRSPLEYHAESSHLPRYLYSTFKQVTKKVYEAPYDLDSILEYDVKYRLPGNFIPKVDVPTMMNNIEARSPFLHPKIVHFSTRLTLQEKRIGAISKGLLKRLLCQKLDKQVAAPIIKGKRGFVLPIDKILGMDTPFIRDTVLKSKLMKANILDQSFVEGVFARAQQSPALYSRLRYSIFSLAIWYEQF